MKKMLHKKMPASGNVLKNLHVWLWALLFLFPLVILVMNSLKTRSEILVSALALPKKLTWENYQVILSDNAFFPAFICSIVLVAMTTSLTVLLGAMTGYSLTRWKSWFSKVFMTIILSTLFVPFQVYMVALIVIVNHMGLTGNLFGLLLVYLALGMPVPIFLFSNYVKGMSIEIEEAAIIDGCSRTSLFFKIVFPLMGPIAATVAILNALWVWGEFLVAFLVYGNHTPMTLPLSQQYFYGTYNNQWNLILAGFVISSVPIIIFYLFMQKHIIKGVAAGAVKG